MSTARRARYSGYSIIEVMMATAILLVGFIGLMQAVTIGSESLDTARRTQVAHQVVSAELEKLRGGAWSVIANLPSSASIIVDWTGTLSSGTKSSSDHPSSYLTCFALSNFSAALTDDNTPLANLARGFAVSFTREYLRPSGATASTATFVKLTYTVTWTSIAGTGRTHTYTAESFLGANGLHLSYQQS